MDGNIEKVWVAKYALTKGIFEIQAKIYNDSNTEMISDINNSFGYYHGEGKEWCRTKEEAIEIAIRMRDNKIKNLKKQMDKLSNMKFS